MIPRTFQEQQIHGKSVFIFEDHATAFVAWGVIRGRLKKPPYIISFDKHLDTRPAFRVHLAHVEGNFRKNSKSKVDQINISNEATATETLRHLQNDEHIDAATQAGIISFAFVISLDACRTGFDEECADAFLLEMDESPDPLDQSIVAPILTRIESIREVSLPDATDFILDIDLDFFRSNKAIPPKNPTAFLDLVKKAYAITIAEEPKYAADSVDYQHIRKELLKLIQYAMES